MRLSTERDRDEAAGIDVLHAGFDSGITLLDTADVYCRDDAERGHNERLIARALATWKGDRSAIVVATKGGMTRPNGQWIPDGRAKTCVSRASRSAVIQAAAERGVPVRCIWLSTSIADAQINAASRIVERYGRLLDAG